jgi:hypothetical protein
MFSSPVAKPVLLNLKSILRFWVNALSEIFFVVQSIKPVFLVVGKSFEANK